MNASLEAIAIRPAHEEDVDLIVHFINLMAQYERMTDVCFATPEAIRQTLFIDTCAEVVFALEAGVEVGFALFYPTYSTFEAKPGIHLEELYVLEEHRGKGIGKLLLQHVAHIAHKRNCARLEWWCLDWNTPAREFYEHLGAASQDEWVIYRLSGEALTTMAKSAAAES